MSTNIWKILAAFKQYEEINDDDAEHLWRIYINRQISVNGFCSVLERRTDAVWGRCEGSDSIWPESQMVYTIRNSGPYSPSFSEENLVWVEDTEEDGLEFEHRAYQLPSGDFISGRLYSASYCTCEACGNVTPNDESVWRNDDLYCYDCDPGGDDDDEGSDDDNPATAVHSYSTKVEDVVRWSPASRKIRYFGIELEQEFGGENRNLWCAWSKNQIEGLRDMSIWKHDGSLDNGAELVSIPMTLKTWQEPNPIQTLCKDREWRRIARSHKTKTCGLHVHVSRSTIPEPVIAKVVYLLNEPCMSEIVALIARRPTDTNYCVAHKKRWHSDGNCLEREGWNDKTGLYEALPAWKRVRETKNITKRQTPQDARYTPVNLTTHTIEFRIFKGTLKWETVLASIEFCDAVISYCTQFGAGKMNDVDFAEWLRTSVTRKTYPALRLYLEERALRAKPRPRPVSIIGQDNTTMCRNVPIQIVDTVAA
jgi:hypothetical protein